MMGSERPYKARSLPTTTTTTTTTTRPFVLQRWVSTVQGCNRLLVSTNAPNDVGHARKTHQAQSLLFLDFLIASAPTTHELKIGFAHTMTAPITPRHVAGQPPQLVISTW
ncbi:hypothetical protein CLAIMM_13272 isoform 2 [Cladophialophora immunda]|nr:hypothetical protein CLAIMM_13272 isoform 1 [Cladophialophora immunda]OQV09103.1 hypothetical protein CLAIMM_13272 isoform 2 [Cladophialophora immunda]